MSHDDFPDARFGLLVPVKRPTVAKSRLAALGTEARVELARAFALDTVSAALASPLVGCVLAVTDDHVLAAALADTGAHVVPDGVSDDLNGTLLQAAAELARRFPGLRPAALCADLPALVADELTAALTVALTTAEMAFVADADGVGTTLVAGADPAAFRPAFGPGSRAAHLDEGALEVADHDAGRPLLTLRRDVDTPEDLEVALALGVGPRTSLTATLLGIAGSPRL
ncbi:MAG: 2-phospho-L-lactate guanylyltransferase [Actinomycetes bacterium]